VEKVLSRLLLKQLLVQSLGFGLGVALMPEVGGVLQYDLVIGFESGIMLVFEAASEDFVIVPAFGFAH
jgi:hypothetical protein